MDIVKIDCGLYTHWAICSDRVDCSGKPYLISNSFKHGTVKEEPWDEVVAGRKYIRESVLTRESDFDLIHKARKAIGKKAYALLQYNCEHFVNEIATGKSFSNQVSNVVSACFVFVTMFWFYRCAR